MHPEQILHGGDEHRPLGVDPTHFSSTPPAVKSRRSRSAPARRACRGGSGPCAAWARVPAGPGGPWTPRRSSPRGPTGAARRAPGASRRCRLTKQALTSPRLVQLCAASPASGAGRATCRTSTGPPPGPGTTPREAGGRSFGPRCSLRRSSRCLRPTTEPLSTSRSISSSAQHRRSRTSSARSSELRPSASPRSMRSLRTPRVPAPIPRSRAISTTGLRVSRTIRTAPALNSGSYLRRIAPLIDDVSTIRGDTHHRPATHPQPAPAHLSGAQRPAQPNPTRHQPATTPARPHTPQNAPARPNTPAQRPPGPNRRSHKPVGGFRLSLNPPVR